MTQTSEIGFKALTYNQFLKQKFGEPVLKIPVSGGFTCPNINGTKGVGGCTYCDNRSFSPVANTVPNVKGQLESGMARAPKRFQKFMAYFQPYSNTFGTVEKLKKVYEPALEFENVVGIAIGTRPDCFTNEIYDYLSDLNSRTYLSVELGVQTIHEQTLININRCQIHQDSVNAFAELKKRNIESVAHMILGFPGETREMIMESAKEIARLPVDGVKIHQLMVIKGTVMEKMYHNGEVPVYEVEEYADVLEEFISYLRPDQVIHRLMADCTFENGLVAPVWSANKGPSYQVIQKRLGLN